MIFAEEEKKCGHASPQFDSKLIDSQFSEANDVRDISSPVRGATLTFREDDKTTIPTISSSQTTTNEASSVVEHTNKVLMTDLQCAVCKQLLCRPVVLNCGHGKSFQIFLHVRKEYTVDIYLLIVFHVAVFCEACIDPHDSVCKCPVCQSAHPKGFSNVCLVLEHFLEQHFPEEYSARKESLPHFQSESFRKCVAIFISCVQILRIQVDLKSL